ncbi:MAG: hypothetical protein GEV06_16375 [Luteitalea sp.]|nr:hypothetical protein [Luteitalea sp.]
MAAVVAHEVKNPLAGVLGSLQIVRTHLVSEGSDAQVVELMAARLRALNAMVDERPEVCAPETAHVRERLRAQAAA